MRFWIILFSMLFWGGFCQAQRDTITPKKQIQYDRESALNPVELNWEKLSHYKESKSFNYENVHRESWWGKLKAWLYAAWAKILHRIFGKGFSTSPGWVFLGQVLKYLIIAGGVGLIIWLFIKLDPAGMIRNPGEEGEVMFSEEERIIRKENIPMLIQKATEEEDYRLALRYYYLLILKLLRDCRLIEYSGEKTNQEYREELNSTIIRQQFEELTELYEFVWYGNFIVSQRQFIRAKTQFENLDTILQSQANE